MILESWGERRLDRSALGMPEARCHLIPSFLFNGLVADRLGARYAGSISQQRHRAKERGADTLRFFGRGESTCSTRGIANTAGVPEV